MNNLIGSELAGRYLISELIARGGMATVYLANDSKLDRKVAIKVIHPHLSDDPVFRDKFFREARMLAKVNHSNLVNIYDQGDDNGSAFIVLELVKGITLRKALHDFGRLKPEQIVQVSKAVLSALAQAHDSGIVHRDLKPENVLLADDGRIKVTDFGLARELSADTDTGSLVGTVAYLAPEVIRRGKSDAASDIYSYGIMLFEMLTGEQPYKGDDAMQIAFKHTSERVPSAKSVYEDVPNKLDQLMLWCTQPLAESRPRNAQDVLDWLGSTALDQADLTATLVLPPQHFETEVLQDLPEDEQEIPFASQSSRLIGFRWLVASLLAVTIGGFSGWYFSSGPGALVSIPSVSDQTRAEAKNSLKDITTSVKTREIYSDAFATGTVVGTDPAAGMLVAKGSEITILISKGKEMVAVPNLLGKDMVTATAQLLAARLVVGKVTEIFSEDYPIGSIYDYTGSDGSKVAVAGAVDLKVSLGAIPVVAGLQRDVAVAALTAAGLEIRKTVYRYSNTVAKNEVISIVPDDLEVGKGSTLKLVVSKGPATVVMPAVKGETILAAKGLLESLGLKVVIDTKWLTKDYGIKKVTGTSEAVGSTLHVGDSVIIRAR